MFSQRRHRFGRGAQLSPAIGLMWNRLEPSVWHGAAPASPHRGCPAAPHCQRLVSTPKFTRANVGGLVWNATTYKDILPRMEGVCILQPQALKWQISRCLWCPYIGQVNIEVLLVKFIFV